MPAIPFAAKPSDGNGIDDPADAETNIVATPLRVCVFGARIPDTALTALRERLPAWAQPALFGACAASAAWTDAERCADIDASAPDKVLIAAAQRFPGEHLILLRTGLDLPELACERLLRALALPDVLAAVALDGVWRRPLPAGESTVCDPHALDALCYAYGEHAICDDPYFFSAAPASLSAWHGARLARLGAHRAHDRDAVEAAGLRVVLLDHLYVEPDTALAKPHRAEHDPRDPEPPSPLAALQTRVAAALAAGVTPRARPGLDTKPVILHVLHGWGGGAERWVRDIATADTAAHHRVLIARGSAARRCHGEWIELHDGVLTGPPLQRFALPRPIADTAIADATYSTLLRQIMRRYCVDAVIVSSLIGHSLDALRSGLPTFCIVHDHYPLWSTLHRDFGDTTLRFDDAQRAADLAAVGSDYEFTNRDPPHWRRLRDATVAAMCHAQATLIAPSRSALANQLRLAPELTELRAHVIPHGLAPWPADAPRAGVAPLRERLRLVIPGRIRRGKGAQLLATVLPRLREQAEVFLLGAGADAHALFGESGVHIVLDYHRDDLPRLIAQWQPDAALLLPTVAETFSYTLSELGSLGVPVVATRVGALAERIDDGVDGFLVDANADAVVARIAALAADRGALDRVRSTLAKRSWPTPADTAREYAALFDLREKNPARYPLAIMDAGDLRIAATTDALHAAHARERKLRADLAAVRVESERRGEWGHALDRELDLARHRLEYLHDELDTRTRWAHELDAQLQDIGLRHKHLHDELDTRTRWAHELDAQLQDIQQRHHQLTTSHDQLMAHHEQLTASHQQILHSTSWRITAPLRSLNARLRGLRASLVFRAQKARALGGRLRGSLARRGLTGTLARIAQEWRGSGPARASLAHAEPGDDFAPLDIPGSDTPRVSIVIPVYNKIAYTNACLHSIAEQAGATPFEVIVVDDGSSDATAQRLADISGIRTLRNARNLGFIGSCNAGAAVARGEYLLFLNNDTVVTTGWLEALVHCIEEAPNAGLVGAKLVYPDGRLQEAGGIVFNDGSGWNLGRFGDPDDPSYAFRREADYCSGAAILLRRDLFARLDGFDTRYTPAYYEDTDLAFAVRAAGLKVYYEPAATVVHFEGITSGTDTTGGIKQYQVVNREKFVDKWKDALTRQPAPGTPITLAATHRAQRRVLIVDATTPTPDQDSGSLRMVNLMRVLNDLGCQVSFLPDNRAWFERYTPALQALGVEALYGPQASDPVKWLRERGREFDLIVLSRHYVAASYIDLVRLYAPQAKLVFDTVDLHYLREQRAAELESNAELARVAAATRAQELKIIHECDVTLVVSPAEQELLSRDAPGARVDVLSNVHEIYGCRTPFAQRRDLVFVGGFQHPPNIDAMEWFVGAVFPLVRAQAPEIRVHVIGSKMPDSIRALADEHVIVHGFVPDIAPYMDGCRISVAPLRYGAGVKGKVNMAMSCGLPVVATPIAVEGMYVRTGEDVLVAADAAAFAAAIIELYRDEALWNRLSTHGMANVERYFSFDAARVAVRRLLDI
ncbi:MAG: glycosyltransferase [Rhodanobacter sp.]|jgi:GT2 family glycosyltransferase/glycosyltransferase involved in cell wall biosynthesis|nr:glycosyltransferase [Rhodanobacter sp.]